MKSRFSFCYPQIVCGFDLYQQENVPISSKGRLLHGSSRRSTHGVYPEKVPNERCYSRITSRNRIFLNRLGIGIIRSCHPVIAMVMNTPAAAVVPLQSTVGGPSPGSPYRTTCCPTLTVKPSGWGTDRVVKPHPDGGEAVRVGHGIGGEAPPPPHPPPVPGLPRQAQHTVWQMEMHFARGGDHFKSAAD
jgi:hypothetical protein